LPCFALKAEWGYFYACFSKLAMLY